MNYLTKTPSYLYSTLTSSYSYYFKSTSLHSACISGDYNRVSTLLSSGSININTYESNTTSLIVACKYGHYNIVELLLKCKSIEMNNADNFGCTALVWAINEGHVNIVKLLLKYNVDYSEFRAGMTPLMYACISGYIEIVELLVKQNVNINIETLESTNATRSVGWAAIDFAAHHQNNDIVKLLSSHGALLKPMRRKIELEKQLQKKTELQEEQEIKIKAQRYAEMEKLNIEILNRLKLTEDAKLNMENKVKELEEYRIKMAENMEKTSKSKEKEMKAEIEKMRIDFENLKNKEIQFIEQKKQEELRLIQEQAEAERRALLEKEEQRRSQEKLIEIERLKEREDEINQTKERVAKLQLKLSDASLRQEETTNIVEKLRLENETLISQLNSLKSIHSEMANKEKEAKLCVVCMDLVATHCLLPCGHRILCASCASNPISSCHICRVDVTGIIQIFDP